MNWWHEVSSLGLSSVPPSSLMWFLHASIPKIRCKKQTLVGRLTKYNRLTSCLCFIRKYNFSWTEFMNTKWFHTQKSHKSSLLMWGVHITSWGDPSQYISSCDRDNHKSKESINKCGQICAYSRKYGNCCLWELMGEQMILELIESDLPNVWHPVQLFKHHEMVVLHAKMIKNACRKYGLLKFWRNKALKLCLVGLT